MPGAIAPNPDDERDESKRQARGQHVQLEHARQALIDDIEIEGQSQMPGAFADRDQTRREGKTDNEQQKEITRRTRHKSACGCCSGRCRDRMCGGSKRRHDEAYIGRPLCRGGGGGIARRRDAASETGSV